MDIDNLIYINIFCVFVVWTVKPDVGLTVDRRGLAFHRCDKPRKLKKLKKLNKLNKLNRKGKAILMGTVATPLGGFEPGSSHAHNMTDGAQNCPILRSASRTNQEILLFRGN